LGEDIFQFYGSVTWNLANENHRKGEERQSLVQPNRNCETGKLRNQDATAMRMRNVIKR